MVALIPRSAPRRIPSNSSSRLSSIVASSGKRRLDAGHQVIFGGADSLLHALEQSGLAFRARSKSLRRNIYKGLDPVFLRLSSSGAFCISSAKPTKPRGSG